MYRRQTVPYRGIIRSCDPLQNFGVSGHITVTVEPKVVSFCTRVGYINSNNRLTYHQQKGCRYGHMTVLKFCRLSWCSASCGFVSDSWATCHYLGCFTSQWQDDCESAFVANSSLVDESMIWQTGFNPPQCHWLNYFRTSKGHCVFYRKSGVVQQPTSAHVPKDKQCFMSSAAAHRPSWRIVCSGSTQLIMSLSNYMGFLFPMRNFHPPTSPQYS